MPCITCKSKNLVRDDISGNLVCDDCGIIQEFDNFDAQLGGLAGPRGTSIHIGYSGSGTGLDTEAKKLYEAQKVIEEVTSMLNLHGKCSDIKTMIHTITDGEFGLGEWFRVLVGACAYAVMRIDDKNVIPMEEISRMIGCDVYDLGRMIMRVVKHLGLKLPEFDLTSSFTRTMKNSLILIGVEKEKKKRIMSQGVFLINCAIKWNLSTGRRPLPLIVAVLAFVVKMNAVIGVGIEDLSKEVQIPLSTCERRYRELLQTLVKVAKGTSLPWAEDITTKNIVKHAPIVIGYMESKAMKKRDSEESTHSAFDLGDVLTVCLSKDGGYWDDDNNKGAGELLYFEAVGENRVGRPSLNDTEVPLISPECLSMMYKKFANDVDGKKKRLASEIDDDDEETMCKRTKELDTGLWWSGKSELGKKILLEKLLEKDIGLDPMPPSFIKSKSAIEKRREKIKAAKLRINKIMHPWDTDLTDDLVHSHAKKKRRKQVSDIDNEDFIIETLLLHQVKEEEIEKGHYKALLGLHVFSSATI